MYEIGTATDHFDLQQKIKTFVTATLPVAQRHILLKDAAEGTSAGDGLNLWTTIFKAPGLNQTDEIFYGIKTYQSVSSDYYNFQIDGFTGYVAPATFETQPGSVYGTGQTGIGVTLWNQAIPYWLVADSRGFLCVAKIQNNYVTFGAGFFIPYATPQQYPYPLFVMGNLPTASATRYSITTSVNGWKGARANMAMRFVDGNWRQPQILPYHHNNFNLRNTNSDSNIATGYYGLHVLELSDLNGTGNCYGVLPNLFFISGFNNTVENTGTISGTTYVVLRDGFNTGVKDYVALKLAS